MPLSITCGHPGLASQAILPYRIQPACLDANIQRSTRHHSRCQSRKTTSRLLVDQPSARRDGLPATPLFGIYQHPVNGRQCRLHPPMIHKAVAQSQQPAVQDCIPDSQTSVSDNQVANGVSQEQNGYVPERNGNEAVEHDQINGKALQQYAGKRTAVLRACKSDAISVKEQHRSLGDYLRLPASQYSVLDAQRIERIDDDTFRCFVGGISFLSFKVAPVLTVSVVVGNGGPTVRLLATELQGSNAVRAVNDKFTATMTNEVRWRDASATAQDDVAQSDVRQGTSGAAPADSHADSPADPSASDSSTEQPLRQITSLTEIQVTLEIPNWLKFLSVDYISRSGSKVMQQVLNRMVPRFLAQLEADYQLWAAGDESRKPIGDGQL